MAFQIISACRVLTKPCMNARVWSTGLFQNGSIDRLADSFKIHEPLKYQVRNTAFFNKLPAESLWKGVTSVSNAGKKRGRGRGVGKKKVKNLNIGQTVGVGKYQMVWPGLTQPIMRGKELVQQKALPEDPERMTKLVKLRDSMKTYKRVKVSPLERGWTGGKPGGRSIGPPDPIGADTFEGFDSKILEFKTVAHMDGILGKQRSISVFAVTGNGNGLTGFALAKAPDGKLAMKKAKNRAAQKLMYIERYNNHTVMHDFFTQFGKTKLFVSKKNEGYGLVCHRAIKTCCEMIGIKDLYAKVEGSTNLQHIIKAFFIGLLQQKTMSELAEEKKLHLVEMKRENDMYPTVVASPSEVRKCDEIKSSEIMDFTQYVMGGKLILKKKKYPPFYTKHYSWKIRQRKQVYLRDKDEVRTRLYADYGELRSFLTDKYPEATPRLWKKKEPALEEAE
ncbi:28S ribosomal protein S5, mitochondrial [Venturia canescens]|uniref:28S ribosomal protein S5, mitochondrial n=1 Tax=Venturia canescens TaxID=32260 RepID=UPI001C9BCDE9|nr:28S ribosomal protein S5, mitochondrial [Venturia canescens]